MRTLILAAAAATAFATPAFAQDAPFSGPRAEGVIGYDSVNGSGDSRDGFLYGGAIGYDIQKGKAVFGIEGEVTGSTTKGTETDALTTGDSLRVSAGRDFYVGARVGYTVTPSTLLYAKGGYTNARYNVDYTSPSLNISDGQNADGFRVGAGLEQKLTGNVYAKAEYRYSHYSDGDQLGDNIDRHQVLAGVGLRF
ncbi:MAG: outer membrane protein [Pseudomonadota bacterium]